MISNKHFNLIVTIFMIIAFCLSSLIMLLPKNSYTASATTTTQPNYIYTIFNDDSIMEINIEMDESSWQEMLDNASNEEYTSANITINGTTYNNVAIRPKGNSSLSQLVMDDSTNRYSFKIKFDKYVDGQTLDGLSKLVLNNNMSDTTSMKEYLSYKLLSYLGVPTPACSYAHITVNGEEWGLYLAVEPIEEEFIQRNYGSTDGNLYKPESDSVAVGNKNSNDINKSTKDNSLQGPPNMNNGDNSMQMQSPPDMNNGNDSMQMQSPPDINNGNDSMQIQSPPNMNNGYDSMQMQNLNDSDTSSNALKFNENMSPNIKGSFGRNSSGADLVWNGDDISNYSAIFDNAIFKTTTSYDYVKILNMIEHLDSMEDIESYLDVDEVLKYFAANTFLVNLDSYVSNMNHNYYLYENNGIVSILPWDYNLSFAGFQAGSASKAINFPIDNPVSDSLEESPLIGKLLEVDDYKELYHNYLNQIVENFINNGTYKTLITKTDALISSYIKNDATAFYTYDEYKNSLSSLINFGYDRATSITAQLNGSQPSTTYGSIETSVDLNAMGQQGGKNDNEGMKNKPFDVDNINEFPSRDSNNNDKKFNQSPAKDSNNSDNIVNQPPTKDLNNDDKNFKNTNLAISPNNKSSSNNVNLSITLLSIALLSLSIPFVLFFKKRKFASK